MAHLWLHVRAKSIVGNMMSSKNSPYILGVWAGDGDNTHFLDPVLEHLPARYQVRKFSWSPRTSAMEMARQIEEVDMAWFEWCNGPVFTGSRLTKGKPAICRLHRYEAYQFFPRKVDWEGIDRLMLISPYMGQVLQDIHPGVVSEDKMVYIPNGVRVDAIPFRARKKRTFRVGFVGRIHYVKNPMLAIHILKRLVERDERYELHMVGPPQHYEVLDYLRHMVKQMGLEDHFVYRHAMPQKELFQWMQQIDVILSTSVIESQGMGIMEAMATGARPVIHGFPGAEAIYPASYLFHTIEEAVAHIEEGPQEASAYREFVATRYGFDKQMEAIVALLDELAEAYQTQAASRGWEKQVTHLIYSGRLEEAEHYLKERMAQTEASSEQLKVYLWQMQLGIEAGDYEYVLLYADKALEHTEQDPGVFFWMGEALWKSGHMEGAVEAWVIAAELLEQGHTSAVPIDAESVYKTAAHVCAHVGQEEAASRFQHLASSVTSS